MYAASASLTSPLNSFNFIAIHFAPPIIFCSGSYGSSTPSPFAVSGISCITPIAPALETQSGLKSDSAFAIAFNRLSDTLYFFAAALKYSSYFVFFIEEAGTAVCAPPDDVTFLPGFSLSSAISIYITVLPVTGSLYVIPSVVLLLSSSAGASFLLLFSSFLILSFLLSSISLNAVIVVSLPLFSGYVFTGFILRTLG